MDKIIKFKAWDKKQKKWVDNEVTLLPNGEVNICDLDSNISDAKDIEIVLFTGRKDKNGKEIYEGEILIRTSNFNGKRMKEYFLVEMKEQRFVKSIGGENIPFILNLKGIRGDIFPRDKVIGNIYENPELLKGSKK